ncbi:hypothetical protein SPFM20_00128 [Salmonella phage SPFM20]|nr:hypothetical protein SPFM20_00128 [Salmonella phage SPFM20]
MVVLEPHVDAPRPLPLVGEPNVDTALPLSTVSNSVDAPRPLATTAEQVEEPISPIDVPSPQPDSIRPLAVEVATTVVLPLADVEGDVVWRVRVIPITLTDTTYWWPVLEEINKDDTGGNPVKVQRCNMRGGSVEWDWANDTTLTRTTVFFTQQLLISKATPLWLISQLGDGSTGGAKTENNKTHYYRVSVPVSPDSGGAGPYPDGIEPVDQALIVTTGTLTATWTALYQAGAIFGTKMTFEWLKFFKDGKIVYLPKQELFTFAELNNLIRPDVAPTGNKYLLAGDSTNGYFGHVSRGYIPVDYLNEAVGYYPDSGLKSLATPTRINLTAYNSVCYLRDLYGVWLSDSSVQSVDAPIAPRVYVPQTAKTVRDLLPARFSGECTVYYDRLTLSDLFKTETTKNGRNTVITLVGKPGKDNPELAGRISADSIGVRGIPDFMGLYSAPELELLCQQVVRVRYHYNTLHCGT